MISGTFHVVSGEKMIVRNEIPILEYDDKSPEVIAPDHDWTGGRLPEKCLFAFLGDVVHKYAKEHDARVADTLITVSHDINVYVLDDEEEEICLVQSPIGAAASAGKVTSELIYSEVGPVQEYQLGCVVASRILPLYPVLPQDDPKSVYVRTLGATLAAASNDPMPYHGYMFLVRRFRRQYSGRAARSARYRAAIK